MRTHTGSAQDPRSRVVRRSVSGTALLLVGFVGFGFGERRLGYASPSVRPAGVWVEREGLLMGTRLRIRARAVDREHGLAAIEDAFRAVADIESLLSSWIPDSEINQINRAELGRSVSLSPRLGDLLFQAVRWSEETDGAFEPVVGALLDVWGIRGVGRVPDRETLAAALESVGPGAITLDSSAHAAKRLSPLAWIDTGAFGKGAALGAAREALAAHDVSDALLDFGGQIMALGSSSHLPGGWPVFVADPGRRIEPTARLRVTDASVATSGASDRYALVEGGRIDHVFDPRTGQPVRSWGSVTVVAEDPLSADAVATALFVLGPEAGQEWARDRFDVGVLFSILQEGGPVGEERIQHRWNRRMERWLEGPASRFAEAVR